MITFKQYLTELDHLGEIMTKKGDVFIDKLLNQRVLVNFKIDTSAFVVMNDSGTLRFFGRDGRVELDLIKRAGSNIWEQFIQHIESQDWKKLPSGVKVFMEMFNDNIPTIVKHASKPRNGLIISFCKKDGKILLPNDKICLAAAKQLDVSAPPIMFDGKMNTKQKKKLTEFLAKPTTTQDEFSNFIMTLFIPPSSVKSLIGDTMEGIVFYFADGSSAKVVDPAFTQQIKAKKDDSDEFYELISSTAYKHLVRGVSSTLNNKSVMKKVMKSNGQQRYIRFISELTADIVSGVAKGLKDVDKYRDGVESKRFSNISNAIVPDTINKVIAKHWWSEDLFRVLLYGIRQEKKRINTRTGLTADRKNLINGIVAKLKEEGVL